MRNVALLFVSLISSGVFAGAVLADSSSWNLPAELNDKNTHIRFEVDSTWHMVHGETEGLRGEAKLLNPEDPGSVEIDFRLPVAKFDTDNSSRDERLREVMSEEKYKDIHFHASGIEGGCSPDRVLSEGSCDGVLKGQLKMLEVEKAVDVPVSIRTGTDGVFHIEGSYAFEWEPYGIEDPSILVAYVDPVVTVFFDVHLSK